MDLDENELSQVKAKWIREQHKLKETLVTTDVDHWQMSHDSHQLDYIGGVDISFVKEDDIHACSALVILSYPDLEVVYEDYEFVHLTAPYIPEFLAFREVSFLEKLLQKLKEKKPEYFPKVIFVDGNGVLHPRGFGLASHLGVITNTCTIGVGKKLFQVDGLEKNVKHLEKLKIQSTAMVLPHFSTTGTGDEINKLKAAGDSFPLVGNSGVTLGAALRSTERSKNPIYVSVGHKISLETSLTITKLCCKHRIPEPIRQADMRSREFLREHYKTSLTCCGCEESKKLKVNNEDTSLLIQETLRQWCSLL